MGPIPEGREDFAAAELGDARRSRRLARLAEALRRRPGESLPDRLAPADYRALLRLANRPEATHEAVLAPHRRATREAMARHDGVVPVLHDTTELDYTGRLRARGMGPIGDGRGRGSECHNSLAVCAATGRPLGLAAQALHARREAKAGRGVAAGRADPRRESRLWPDGVAAVGPAPPGAAWVHVADRGADTFELLRHLHGRRLRFVIRSCHNRATADGDPIRLAHDRLRARPAMASWPVEIPPGPGRAPRRAAMHAAWTALTPAAPHVRRGEHSREPVPVGVLRAWEPDPPAGATPLEWLLLSDEVPADAAAAREVAGWYERRWIVEELHKGMKSGQGVEGLRAQTAGAIGPLVALLSAPAVSLLQLRSADVDEATAGRPASELVGEATAAVLCVAAGRPPEPLTVRAYLRRLARLGGWMDRRRGARPGWQVLWRGQRTLIRLLEYEESRRRCGEL